MYPRILQSGKVVTSLGEAQVDGLTVAGPRSSSAGLAIQAIVVSDLGAGSEAEDPDASVTLYFASRPLTGSDTFVELMLGGGGMLVAARSQGRDAAFVAERTKGAMIVQVGEYDAALVHSDVLPGGVRVYGLYWSDGSTDYSLILNRGADDVVRTAQSLYCP